MKLGIHLEPHVGYEYEEIMKLAKKAEQEGFNQFTVSDHFFGSPKRKAKNCYEAWTLLALLTPQTTNIRLGTLVTSQSYRNPALLAKIVSNLDNASNGRIFLGMGAGWKASEYKAYGYEFPRAPDRIRQLREAIEVITHLWTKKRPSFKGEYYSICDALFEPKPVQKPTVPIWIGTMTLAAPMMEYTIAKYADVIDYEGASTEQLREKMRRMKLAFEKVDRESGDLDWSTSITAYAPASTEQEYKQRVEHLFTIIPEKYHQKFQDDLKNSLSGTPEEMAERLRSFDESGIDYLTICLPWIGDVFEDGMRTIEIVKDEIMPLL